MDAVRIETLPSSKSLLNASAPENTDISKEKDEAIFSVDENSDDDEIQLRLSDDEDTEPDYASDHSKCPQTNIHPQNKDLKLLGSATPAKKSKSHCTKSSPKQNSCKEEAAFIIKQEILENSIVDEKSPDDLGSIDDQDSTMSGSEKPPYMQNSPKYWNNHFDKRWSGASSPRDRQNYPHRNSSDWYRQQFPDKNQFSHKGNLSNHNNQFSRLRSSSRGSYDQSRDKWRRDSDRESKNKFLRSRRSLEKTEVTSLKENGVCNDTSLVKHDTHVEKKESSVSVVSQNKEKVEEKKKDSDQKIEKVKLTETKVISGQESDSSSVKTSDKLGENDSKPIDASKNSVDVRDSSDNLTQTKDCDEPLTENKKEECNSKTENSEEKKSEDIQNTVEETTEDGQTKSTSSVEEQVCHKDEMIDETDLKKSNTTSEHENEKSENSENLMEVDENNTNSCDSGFTNSTSNGKSSSSDNSKDSDIELSDNNDKNAEEKNTNNGQVTEAKENSSDDLDDAMTKVDDPPPTEEASQSSDETSLALDKSEKSSESDGLDSDLIANVPDNEVSQDPNQEPSKPTLLVVSEKREVNYDDLKVSADLDSTDDSENSSKIDENECDQAASLEDESENNIQEHETKKTCDDDESMKSAESDEHESLNNIVEEVDLLEDEMEVSEETPSMELNPSKQVDDVTKDESINTKTADGKEEEMNVDTEAEVHNKHRRRKTVGIDCSDTANEDEPKEKRVSAKSAEDLIRKGVTTDDENEEDPSGDSETNNPVQVNQENTSIEELRSSPTVQKRALEDVDSSAANANSKRIRMSSELPSLVPMTPQPSLVPTTPQPSLVPIASQPYEKRDYTSMSKENSAKTNELVRKVSTEIGKLKKMTLEEIEALVLQKITESLTFRGENGKLREEVKSLKRSLEASRTKCQQLQKQVEGFDMVLKRITYDKNSNADKYLPPIKINRSVGLQVNFLSSEHGVQNLKQIQMRAAGSNSSPIKTVSPLQDSGNRPTVQSPRKQVKTRSPRRPETVGPVPIAPAPTSPVSSMTPMANGQMVSQGSQMAGLTPMNKQTPEIVRRPLTLPTTGSAIKDLLQQQPQQTLQQPLQHALQQLPQQSLHQPMHHQPLQQTLMQPQQQPMQIQQSIQAQQHIPQSQQVQLQQPIVVASSLNNQPSRTSGIMNKSAGSTSNNTSDLIDLTDEEERAKPSVVTMTSSPGYQRVIQTVPTSVPLSNGTNLRLVQTSVQSPPNAVVNSAGRILYTMPSSVNGQPRQIVLANSNTMRPITNLTNKNISSMAYKQVVPTLQNGTVRVITASGSQNMLQPARHPAPLPETPVMESNPKWKLTPPAPSLKISKVANGIVLSWNMVLSDKFAEIVSYQLYAYQEIAGTAPNAAQWKKVGDVRALPLPMACTLTQFTEGNNYYFAVRAVDIHSRLGQYSRPGNISL